MFRDRFKCIIAVRASRQVAANTFFKNQINNKQGGDTFTQGLNATGTGTPTWYWAGMTLEKWQLAKIIQVGDQNPTDIRIIIWGHQRGVKKVLQDRLGSKAYVTIVNERRSAQQFLTAVGMQVVRPAQI